MTAEPHAWATELLRVWFSELGPDDWYTSNDDVDAMLRERFEGVLLAMELRPSSEFLSDPKTARAAIILFDQVPRNIYRGTPRAFAFDAKASMLAKEAIARGWDKGLSEGQRQFVGMPLMHSEDLADQEACLAFFAEESNNLSFARTHHQMIAKFGRFPHRNAALGRETTKEEQQAIDEGFSW